MNESIELKQKRIVWSYDEINKYSPIVSLPPSLINYLKRTSTFQINDHPIPRILRGIMNQLTTDNLNRKVVEIISCISKYEHFQKLSELIFDMVILETTFNALYAKLCKILSRFCITENNNEYSFTYVLLKNFSSYFDKYLEGIEKISLTSVADEQEWFKRKTFIKFVAELHNNAILNRYNLSVCINNLYDSKVPNKIFLMCKLIQGLNPNKIKKNKLIMETIQKINDADLTIYPKLIIHHITELKDLLKKKT